MPMSKGCTREAFSKNVKLLMEEGKPQKQAVAIAYSWQRKHCGGFRVFFYAHAKPATLSRFLGRRVTARSALLPRHRLSYAGSKGWATVLVAGAEDQVTGYVVELKDKDELEAITEAMRTEHLIPKSTEVQVLEGDGKKHKRPVTMFVTRAKTPANPSICQFALVHEIATTHAKRLGRR